MFAMAGYFRILDEMLLRRDSVFPAQPLLVIVLFSNSPQLGGSLLALARGSIMAALLVDDEPEPDLAAVARAN